MEQEAPQDPGVELEEKADAGPQTVQVLDTETPAQPREAFVEVEEGKTLKPVTNKPRSPLDIFDLVYRVVSALFFVGVWILMLIVVGYFAWSTTKQLIAATNSPGTTVEYIEGANMEFPMLTVCPFAYDANITLDYCVRLNDDATSCEHNVRWTPFDMKNGHFMYCIQFNFDASDAITTNSTGRRGGVSIGFSFDADADPNTIDFVQATFTKPGMDPTTTMLEDEVRYIQGGQSLTYGLQMIRREYLRNETKIDYETSSSVFIMTPFPPPPSTQESDIVLAYQTLSVLKIKEVQTYQLQNWFGDNSGIIGTLTGISVIKFLGVLARIYPSIRVRSLSMIGDLLTS